LWIQLLAQGGKATAVPGGEPVRRHGRSRDVLKEKAANRPRESAPPSFFSTGASVPVEAALVDSPGRRRSAATPESALPVRPRRSVVGYRSLGACGQAGWGTRG